MSTKSTPSSTSSRRLAIRPRPASARPASNDSGRLHIRVLAKVGATYAVLF